MNENEILFLGRQTWIVNAWNRFFSQSERLMADRGQRITWMIMQDDAYEDWTFARMVLGYPPVSLSRRIIVTAQTLFNRQHPEIAVDLNDLNDPTPCMVMHDIDI